MYVKFQAITAVRSPENVETINLTLFTKSKGRQNEEYQQIATKI